MFGCPENSLCTSMSLSVCLRKICERMIFGRIRSQDRDIVRTVRETIVSIYPGMPSSFENVTLSDFWVVYGLEDVGANISSQSNSYRVIYSTLFGRHITTSLKTVLTQTPFGVRLNN